MPVNQAVHSDPSILYCRHACFVRNLKLSLLSPISLLVSCILDKPPCAAGA